MMKNNGLFVDLLSAFFLKHIPTRSNYSQNTIKAYRDTFILFFQYQDSVIKIPVEKLKFEEVDNAYIHDFIDWLSSAKGYANSSINNRLAAINAFFRYVMMEAPEHASQCRMILEIKTMKVAAKPMNYLSADAIRLLLSKPDVKTAKGRRDLAILSLLYDTGARVQEIADLTFADYRSNGPATVRLTGKGNKTRIIPIMPQTNNILSAYIKDCQRCIDVTPTSAMFFNKQHGKLTRAGITYILQKYVSMAKNERPDRFQNVISPHTLRHSKAMHLLEGGVNLIYIRDFLGHASVTTTEVYAKANPEIKRKAIENASLKVLPKERFSTEQKQGMMAWLKGLI